MLSGVRALLTSLAFRIGRCVIDGDLELLSFAYTALLLVSRSRGGGHTQNASYT